MCTTAIALDLSKVNSRWNGLYQKVEEDFWKKTLAHMTNTNTAIRAVDYHPRWFIRFDVIPSNWFITHDIHLITLCIDCASI